MVIRYDHLTCKQMHAHTGGHKEPEDVYGSTQEVPHLRQALVDVSLA